MSFSTSMTVDLVYWGSGFIYLDCQEELSKARRKKKLQILLHIWLMFIKWLLHNLTITSKPDIQENITNVRKGRITTYPLLPTGEINALPSHKHVNCKFSQIQGIFLMAFRSSETTIFLFGQPKLSLEFTSNSDW